MIQEGLLWFDDSPSRAVTEKIERAVQRYQQKYGHHPDVCYVHPAHLKEGEVSMADALSATGVKVLPAKSVLPHHFWLGTQPQPGKGQAGSSRSLSRSQRHR
jgi:hypothetical protein